MIVDAKLSAAFQMRTKNVVNSFHVFALEQLNRAAPPVRARRMFGGVGLYAGELFFALMDDDALYLKTDSSTQAEFEARGMPAFQPAGEDGPTMHYHQLPEDVLEDPEALRRWVEKAIGVARQSRSRSGKRRVQNGS